MFEPSTSCLIPLVRVGTEFMSDCVPAESWLAPALSAVAPALSLLLLDVSFSAPPISVFSSFSFPNPAFTVSIVPWAPVIAALEATCSETCSQAPLNLVANVLRAVSTPDFISLEFLSDSRVSLSCVSVILIKVSVAFVFAYIASAN